MSGFGRTTQRVHDTFTPDEGRDHTWTGILSNLDLRGLQGLLTALLTLYSGRAKTIMCKPTQKG